MIIAYQLQYINAAADNTCKRCKQFNKAQHGEQLENETVLNYVARGEYPAGTTKEQKRAIRRRTMHVCKGRPNFRSGG